MTLEWYSALSEFLQMRVKILRHVSLTSYSDLAVRYFHFLYKIIFLLIGITQYK